MKRTSIKEVANAAGVSITTVSRALNGYSDVSIKTREKIKRIAEEMNYAPDINARSLGGMSETTIALLVSDLQPKDESGLAFGVISGLYRACVELGCEFILLATNAVKQEEITFLQLCRKKNVDGIVVMGLRMDDAYYEEVLNSPVPCVLIDINNDRINKHTCTVSIDNIQAAKTVVEHLIQKGRRKIGMLNGKPAAQICKERFSGYAGALLEAGIILNLDYLRYSDFSEEKAYEDTKEMLIRYPEVDALFCASDLMAVGAIRAIENLGKRVPEDIAIAGFDDIPIAAYFHGGLTTVRQNPYEMGRMAGNCVHHLLNKEEVPSKVQAPYEFLIRHTTE